MMTSRMARLVALIAIALLLISPATLRAADDVADVKTAAKKFFTAMAEGNNAELKAMSIGTEPEVEFLDATASMLGARKHLVTAAEQKFGEQGKTISPMNVKNDSTQVEAGQVNVDGDTASLVVVGGNPDKPMRWRRVGSEWKADLSSLQLRSTQIDAPRIRAMAQAMNVTASEIESGKYAKVADAQMALGQRLRDIALDTKPSTTSPSKS